ncbi:hypothetical protein BJ508DRAFT_410423 [Ascobolus immersus RN42]|uniref:Uncharacterized protein n=1 Tax=Ascobolus immersus RN42 TaxID=1160509 RepID=A0A3N4IP30_ASCIM|nr:hypothetical protein BJ508DRAFT_410423 [Ascobolus immersus RN42]
MFSGGGFLLLFWVCSFCAYGSFFLMAGVTCIWILAGGAGGVMGVGVYLFWADLYTSLCFVISIDYYFFSLFKFMLGVTMLQMSDT